MNLFFLRLLYLFNSNPETPSKTLEKKKDEGFFSKHYETLLTFLFSILIVLMILLVAIGVIVVVEHGTLLFGTEANHYQNLELLV